MLKQAGCTVRRRTRMLTHGGSETRHGADQTGCTIRANRCVTVAVKARTVKDVTESLEQL
jgi:hypothetical protein